MLLFSVLSFSLLTPYTSVASIYGHDDRVEYSQVQNAIFQKSAQATAAMIPIHHLQQTDHGTLKIDAPSFGKQFGLCSTERFFDQPSAADCSGFLIADDLLVTAGHCVEGTPDESSVAWVFGYRYGANASGTIEVPPENVYSGTVIDEKFEFLKFIDYALIRLDRKVTGFRPVTVAKTEIQAQARVVLAGFPSGIPLKLAEGSVFTTQADFFVTDLDAFSINSGSLVFNAETGEAEGILSAGYTDFHETDQGCRVSTVYPESSPMTIVSRIPPLFLLRQ